MAFLLWFRISFTAGLANMVTAESIQLALDAKADLERWWPRSASWHRAQPRGGRPYSR